MNATHRSSRHTNVPGISPSMMRVKIVAIVPIRTSGTHDRCRSRKGVRPRCWTRIWTIPNLFTLVRLLCLPIFVWLLFGRDNQAGGRMGARRRSAPPTGSTATWHGGSTRPASSARCSTRPSTACCSSSRSCRSSSTTSIPIWFGVAVLAREVLVGVMMVVATLVFKMRALRRHLAGQDRHVPADVRRARIPDGQQRLSRCDAASRSWRGASGSPASS